MKNERAIAQLESSHFHPSVFILAVLVARANARRTRALTPSASIIVSARRGTNAARRIAEQTRRRVLNRSL
jgi:hypothetical protein